MHTIIAGKNIPRGAALRIFQWREDGETSWTKCYSSHHTFQRVFDKLVTPALNGGYPCDSTIYEVEFEAPSKDKVTEVIKNIEAELSKLRELVALLG